MKLQFKFRDDASGEDRQRVIASLTSDGADKVEPIFPDANDGELSTLYRALVGERDSKRLLRRLKRSRLIEFAEPQPERHLIAPIELERQVTRALAPARSRRPAGSQR